MARFAIRHIPPIGVQRDPDLPAFELSEQTKRALYTLFKQELLNPRSPLDMLMTNLPDMPPLPVKLNRLGDSALVAMWLRGAQLDTAAFTILLSDIDATEDHHALASVEDVLVGDVEVTRPKIHELIELIGSERRPLSATVHMDEHSYDDPATHVCAAALGRAFFDQYGVSG